MKVMVLSDKHHLLPVAWRLKKEGTDLAVAVVHSRKYQKAWAGRLNYFLNGEKITDDVIQKVVEAAKESDTFVLTDSKRWTETFKDYPRLFGTIDTGGQNNSPLSVGSWFDGEGFAGTHLVLDDVGAWTGGMGPTVVSSTTLVRLDDPDARLLSLVEDTKDALKSLGFKGLVKVPFAVSKDGSLQRGDLQMGWPMMHSHVFCADQPSLSNVLEGYAPVFPKRYVVGISVTIPPWPSGRTTNDPQLIEVQKEAISHIMFHDMVVQEDHLETAGLDGFVAVARGSGDTLQMATHRAGAVASSIGVNERQYRLDAGRAAEAALVGLDHYDYSV
jgi:phosphoribosylamine-glycine ligase